MKHKVEVKETAVVITPGLVVIAHLVIVAYATLLLYCIFGA